MRTPDAFPCAKGLPIGRARQTLGTLPQEARSCCDRTSSPSLSRPFFSRHRRPAPMPERQRSPRPAKRATTARACSSRETGPPRATKTHGAETFAVPASRSEEHTSELQSLMRISYAVFCLKKKKKQNNKQNVRNRSTMKTIKKH